MRNLKRVLSLALALVMVLGMMVITTSAADFADADDITYTEAVEVMSTIGILKGYEAADGTFTFNPKGTLNRQEAAKILAFVCMGTDADDYLTGSTVSFSDVEEGHWAAKYIAFCKNAKIINGMNDAQTLFNPTGTLTTVQFAKMLLVAVGIEGEYTGANWAQNVKDAVAKVNELKATGIKIDDTNITREEACELALAAMKYSPVSDSWELKKNGVTIKSYADAVEAAMAAAVLGGEAKGYTVELAEGEDSLLQTVYGVKYGTNTDAFGRATNVYTDVDTGKPVITLYASEAAYVFTKAVKADDLAVDLKGLKAGVYEIGKDVEASATIEDLVQDNGAEKDLTIDAKKALEDAIAGLTGDHKTVEIYVAKGVISNIVVIDTYYGKVTKVTPANAEEKVKASIEIGSKDNYFETTGYEVDDQVAYTKVGTEIQSVELLDSFTAQLTKYTAKGEYTIGGEVYEVTAEVAAKIKASAKDYLGVEKVYYVGNNGIIVADGSVKKDDVKVTDYLKVLNAAAAQVPNGSLLNTTYDWATEVEVLLPDGTTATYELALTTKDGKTTIGKLATEIAVNADGVIEALVNNFYNYTVADGVLTLVSTQKVEAVNLPYSTEREPAVNDYIINSDTVIILRVTDEKDNTKWTYKTVKGLAAAEKSDVIGSAVVSEIKDAKGDVTAQIVDVIFADGCEFEPAKEDAKGTETYVYYDGTYDVGYDAVKKVEVYTGVVTKIDGTTVELEVKGTEGAGVFELQDDNTLKAAGTEATVNVIAGDMYKLGDEYVTVNDTTKVLVVAKDAALVKDAKVVYIAEKGVATEIFVIEAAPKA